MNNPELSNNFDIYYNNITSNQAPGLDEFEKSVFLTRAQDEIVRSYFDSRTNKVMEGFDGSEKRQIDFSTIIKNTTFDSLSSSTGLFSNAKKCSLPADTLIIINEFVTASEGNKTKQLVVIPIGYQELSRLMSKPYKRPNKGQAWRIINNAASANNEVELVAGMNDTISSYYIRYVKKPRPIVLQDFTADGLTVNGVSTVSECELDPILHEEILQRAVELAKAAYTGGLTEIIAVGSSSGTNLGVPQAPQQQQR